MSQASTPHTVWREWLRPLLLLALTMVSFRSAVADWNDVPTGSMRPTIEPGDRIFVNKLAYDLRLPLTFIRLAEWAEPQRGEVVVLFSPEEEGLRLVKRIVAGPGDSVAVRGDRLVVNGVPARYEWVEEGRLYRESLLGSTRTVRFSPDSPALRDFGPYVVPEGQYFVMGDNRDRSKDSRIYGPVSRERIVGRATTVVASIDREHWAPRWNRFFLPLGDVERRPPPSADSTSGSSSPSESRARSSTGKGTPPGSR